MLQFYTCYWSNADAKNIVDIANNWSDYQSTYSKHYQVAEYWIWKGQTLKFSLSRMARGQRKYYRVIIFHHKNKTQNAQGLCTLQSGSSSCKNTYQGQINTFLDQHIHYSDTTYIIANLITRQGTGLLSSPIMLLVRSKIIPWKLLSIVDCFIN